MMRHPLLSGAISRLRTSGVATPDVDAEILLAFVTRTTRGSVRAGVSVSAEQRDAYERLITRRAAREPLQHLTESAPFRYLELIVGPGVFVPRPETESLAGWAIDLIGALDLARPVVVDLCTGSGAIAASIAHEMPHAQVHAVELDDRAYAYAQRNLDGSRVDLRRGDISTAFADLDETVDIVVANPPYIPLAAFESVEQEVRDHDPSLALWAGEDGLDAIATVEAVAHRLLRAHGQVGCEHADVQGESAPRVFTSTGHWTDVRDRRDLADRPRFVTATTRRRG